MRRVDVVRGARAVGEEPDGAQELRELPPHIRHQLQRVTAEKIPPRVVPPATNTPVRPGACPPFERTDQRDVVAVRVPSELSANGVGEVLLVHRQHERVLVRHPCKQNTTSD